MQRIQVQRRFPALVIATITLGSCSYGFDIRAGVIDGRLAFVSNDSEWDCIADIYVTTETPARAVPAKGDDAGLIQNGGAFWWTESPVTDCKMNFPVFYGTENGRTSVAPKPLHLGVTYAVHTQGEGAYGSGCFRITNERKVLNLALDICNTPMKENSES